LEVEAAAKAMQIDRLSGIWERTPARILKHEAASLLVYRWLSARSETEAADSLAATWTGKAKNPGGWTLAQVDALMGNGKGEDARKLLEAQRDWQPNDEPERLVRLALLQARTDLNAAWKLLEKASELAPRNADVRSFRGQILEAAGRFPEARVEYVAALVAEPGNPLRRDQLALFYLRLGDYDHAVPTWLEGHADAGEADFLRLKGRFWAQVVQPALGVDFKTPAAADFSSPWRAALDAIELAPPGKWLAMLPGGVAPALRQHGEIWWLELLDRLQAGDEAGVAEALDTQSMKAAALAPDLSAALRTVLALRSEKPLNGIIWPTLARGAARPSYFGQLEKLTTSARAAGGQVADEATLALARHPAGLAYVFAVAGWREAALRLQAWEKTERIPEPMLYTVAMCLKFNRGPAAAAALLKDRPGVLLQGLAGECLLASGEVEAGLKQLQAIAKDPSAAGQRAAWLLALAYLERRDLVAARTVVADSPRLTEAVSGQEILARIALAEGNKTEATRIYRLAAEAGSVEGRTWMLREAVAAGNAAEAQKESMILREQLPDEMQTRANQLKLPPAPPVQPAPPAP
jgi:Flp pilus assembly protein TadD